MRIYSGHSIKTGRPVKHGVTIIEATFLLPLLVMLAFGVVDFGYYMYLKNTLQGAAQAGARAAILASATNSDITGASGITTTMLNAAGIRAGNYTVTLAPSNIGGLSPGTQITVTITATWGAAGTHLLTSTFGGVGSSKQIIGTAVMLKEST